MATRHCTSQTCPLWNLVCGCGDWGQWLYASLRLWKTCPAVILRFLRYMMLFFADTIRVAKFWLTEDAGSDCADTSCAVPGCPEWCIGDPMCTTTAVLITDMPNALHTPEWADTRLLCCACIIVCNCYAINCCLMRSKWEQIWKVSQEHSGVTILLRLSRSRDRWKRQNDPNSERLLAQQAVQWYAIAKPLTAA